MTMLEGAEPAQMARVRGAIFFVSNATWGSSRIEGMQHSRHTVLRGLLLALNRREGEICEEVLLSMKRLLGKFGPSLRFEWDVVFQILEKVVEALWHVSDRASRTAQADDQAEQAVAGRVCVDAHHPAEDKVGKGAAGGDGSMQMTALVEMVGKLRKTQCFHGLDADFFRLVSVASLYAPRELALEALDHMFLKSHPAYSSWLQTAGDLMDRFFGEKNDEKVRIRALKGVWDLVDDYQAMYEEELVDVLVIPNLQHLHRERCEAVSLFALRGLTVVARKLQSDRFAQLLDIIVSVAQHGDTNGKRLAAVRSLLSIFEATFARIPSSRFLEVYNALLPLVSADNIPVETRVLIIDSLANIQASSNGRPILVLTTGTLHSPSLLVFSTHVSQKDEGGSGAAGREVLDMLPLFDAFVGLLESDASPLIVFNAATRAIVRGLQNRVVFEGQDAARLARLVMLRLETGHWGVERDHKPTQPFGRASSSSGTSNAAGLSAGEGPSISSRANSSKLMAMSPSLQLLPVPELDFSSHAVAYTILELVSGGWGMELGADLLKSITMCFVDRLRLTEENARSRSAAGFLSTPGWASDDFESSSKRIAALFETPSALHAAGSGKQLHAGSPIDSPVTSTSPHSSSFKMAAGVALGGISASMRLLPVQLAQGQQGQAAHRDRSLHLNLPPQLVDSARVCIHALTLGSLLWQHLIPLHLPVVLDLMAILERDKEYISLATSCIQYTKFIAVQGCTYAIPIDLTAKYLKVLSSFSDQRRWGGIIANLSMRSIALMYLQTSMPNRTRVARDVIPLLQERSKGDDPISATMLDWILRHATSDLSSQVLSINDPSDVIFENPGTKTKTYAVGNSVITVRSSVIGLISIIVRRPTDLSRWIFMSPRTRVGKGARHTVNGLVSLLLSRLKVPDVHAVGKHPVIEEDKENKKGHVEGADNARGIAGAGESSKAVSKGDAPIKGGGRAGAGDVQVGQVAAAGGAAAAALAGVVQSGQAGGDGREAEAEEGVMEEGVAEALDPDVVLLQWRRGPFAEGGDSGPKAEELIDSQAFQRAVRLLDMTPLTFTHKFGIIYIGHSQQCEADFLRNTCGSALYEEFLNNLGTHTPLAMCTDDVFTGGLDRNSCKDGEFALLWRSSLAQCAFFVGTLMPLEPGEQINKKRFIGNTYVKIVYTDSNARFSLADLSGQFNLVVVLIKPLPNRSA